MHGQQSTLKNSDVISAFYYSRNFVADENRIRQCAAVFRSSGLILIKQKYSTQSNNRKMEIRHSPRLSSIQKYFEGITRYRPV